jgi:very-short-patch-repair endonuclease
MEYVIFGNSKSPDLSFSVEPERGGSFQIQSNTNYILYGGDEQDTHSIDWWFLVMFTLPELASLTYPDWSEARSRLQDSLGAITATRSEKVLLDEYLRLSSDKYPALIPQTWVNWLHYSPQDPQKAKRAKNEPFRVDFTMYWEHRKIIVEIDGSSHFSEIFDVDGTGRIRYEASMDKYTEHLRKDRWLRSKGWEVWRFSEAEILDKDFDISAVLAEMKIRIR